MQKRKAGSKPDEKEKQQEEQEFSLFDILDHEKLADDEGESSKPEEPSKWDRIPVGAFRRSRKISMSNSNWDRATRAGSKAWDTFLAEQAMEDHFTQVKKRKRKPSKLEKVDRASILSPFLNSMSPMLSPLYTFKDLVSPRLSLEKGVVEEMDEIELPQAEAVRRTSKRKRISANKSN